MSLDTIQLTPRLPDPTLATAALVVPNVHVNKSALLFQLDRRIYENGCACIAKQRRPPIDPPRRRVDQRKP